MTECDWSVGCLDQWAYTHIILEVFVRVISLLLWSCQFTGKKKFEHRLKKSATVNVFSVAIEVFVYSYFPYQSHLPLERSRDREVDPRGLCLPVAFMCPKKLKKPIKRKKKFCLQLSHFGYFRKSSKVNFWCFLFRRNWFKIGIIQNDFKDLTIWAVKIQV